MLARKVCMIGDISVGKTSLVRRFVHRSFSDRYLTTVGVKVDTKPVTLPDGEALKLVLWDIAGTDRFSTIETGYLRGAAGYLLVVDGTRGATLETARQLQSMVVEELGDVPFVTLLNKHDLSDRWDLKTAELHRLEESGWALRQTSALTGSGVESAFDELAGKIGHGR